MTYKVVLKKNKHFIFTILILQILLISFAASADATEIARGSSDALKSALITQTQTTPSLQPSPSVNCVSGQKCKEIDQIWSQWVAPVLGSTTKVWDISNSPFSWQEFDIVYPSPSTTQIDPAVSTTDSIDTTSTFSVADLESCHVTTEPNGKKSSAVGKSNGGSLINGVPLTDKNFLWSKTPRNANYGTIELVNTLEYTACYMQQEYGAKLWIQDLSKDGGGHLSPHASHQSGLDVDVGYYTYQNGKYENEFKVMCERKGKGFCKTYSVLSKFNNANALQANWDFIKMLNSLYDIKAIFIDPELIRVLKEFVGDEEWKKYGRTVSGSAPGHHHHYHIRIMCPKGDDQCNQGHDYRASKNYVGEGFSGTSTGTGTGSSAASLELGTLMQIEHNTAGVDFYKYKTSCQSNVGPKLGRVEGIIIPQNIAASEDITVNFYFHGHDGKSNLKNGGNDFVENSVKSRGFLNKIQGKNEILVMFRGSDNHLSCINNQGNACEWMKGKSKDGTNKPVFDCFYQEAMAHIKSKLGKEPTSISLMGHSGGGSTIWNVVNSGFLNQPTIKPLKNIIFYDACYGTCDNVAAAVKEKIFGKIYVFYRSGTKANSQSILPEVEGNKVVAKQTSVSHNNVPQKCLTYHLAEDESCLR